MRQKNWAITLSAGLLTCTGAPSTVHDLMKTADKLMYSAKSDGRNTVKYSIYAG